MVRTAALISIVLTFIVPTQAQKLGKDVLAAIATSPEQIAERAVVKNDPLDTVVRVDTSNFYVDRQGLLKFVSSDKFMRAVIDKKTGEANFQIYLWTEYSGDWMFFNRLNYMGPTGPESVEVHQIERRVVSCSRYGCTHVEHIAADIPESVLRDVAKDAKAGVDASWLVKVFGKSTEGSTTGVLKTEIAGILLAVDRERAKLGFSGK